MRSGAIDDVAVIRGPQAHALLLMLGDWRRAYVGARLPGSPAAVRTMQETIDALAAAAEAARRASASGNPEAERKPSDAGFESWLTSSELARQAGVTSSRIRQLARGGRIEFVEDAGRYRFPPSTVERVRALRRGA